MVLSCILSLYHRDRGRRGRIKHSSISIIISLLVALAVLLAMAYKVKSAETTPSNGTQKSGWQVEHVVKQKNKHSSSTSGIVNGPGVVKTGEVNGGKKKRGRRKRSSSSPKVGVGSQIQLAKEKKESTKQDSTRETMPGIVEAPEHISS